MNAKFKCGCSFDKDEKELLDSLQNSDWFVATINPCRKHKDIMLSKLLDAQNINLV